MSNRRIGSAADERRTMLIHEDLRHLPMVLQHNSVFQPSPLTLIIATFGVSLKQGDGILMRTTCD
jgi:hypothetical protein